WSDRNHNFAVVNVDAVDFREFLLVQSFVDGGKRIGCDEIEQHTPLGRICRGYLEGIIVLKAVLIVESFQSKGARALEIRKLLDDFLEFFRMPVVDGVRTVEDVCIIGNSQSVWISNGNPV